MITNEKILMIDTETTNSIDDPIVYDIGFTVFDLSGKTYEKHSYVVADVFLDKDLMASAYFADKIPQYWEDIKSGKRLLRRFKTIRFIIKDIMTQYNIKIVCAHNSRFDYKSLNLTQRFLSSSKYRFFFPYGTEIWDTLKMSREVLKKNNEYKDFCKRNDYITANGQNRFTAEIIHRFLTGENDFIESHTALEDVEIEQQIFEYCLSVLPEIDGRLWA